MDKDGCIGCGCLSLIAVAILGSMGFCSSVNKQSSTPTVATTSIKRPQNREPKREVDAPSLPVPPPIPASDASAETSRAQSGKTEQLSISELLDRDEQDNRRIDAELSAKLRILPDANDMRFSLRSLSTQVTEMNSLLKSSGTHATIASQLARNEGDLTANKSRMSSGAYERASRLIAGQKTRLTGLRQMHLNLQGRLAEIEQECDQWLLNFDELRKVSGTPFSQSEVAKEIRKYLTTPKTPAPTTARPPFRPTPTVRNTPSPNEATTSGGWDANSYGRVKQALGIMVSLNREGRPSNIETGVLVEHIFEGLPGAGAGLRLGDLILAINGQVIRNKDDLSRLAQPGHRFELTVRRRTGSGLEEKTMVIEARPVR
jgi:hypothetical protein